MNVVLIAVDALRADRLGCYGYGRETSPFMDSLAANGVVFENHFTPAVPTQPAFTTIYSGTHPLTHGIVAHEGLALPNPRVTWLPLLMKFHGVTSVTVDNLADHKPWFWRGFEYYINPRRRGEFPNCHIYNERAIEWLERCRHEPFFLSVHYWDPHTPYDAELKYTRLFYEGDPTTTNMGSLDAFYQSPQVKRWPENWFAKLLENWPNTTGKRIEDKQFILAHYDAEIRMVDDGVRQLCDVLENIGILEDTLLIIFGDHGEELAGDHGIYFDHHGLYDSNIRVPMILHWPKGLAGSAGRRVTAMTQHQDLFPTVLEAMDLKTPPDVIEGQSMLPLARGEASSSHWHHLVMACECTWQAKWAMRTPEYKLIVSRQPDFHGKPPIELYDLLKDPGEQQNIGAAEPLLRNRLLQKFDATLVGMLGERGCAVDPIAVNPITLGARMFKRLGRPYPPKDPNWQGHPPPVLGGRRQSVQTVH